MFRSARLKLTGFYLIIILFISGLFSTAFYNVSTREIDRIIIRLEFDRQPFSRLKIVPPGTPSIEELLSYKKRMKATLIAINGLILVVAGGAGYFLAGKTLNPIQLMVDEQNQFISDASHELRTPMATLQAEMEAKLLEKNISDKEARSLIKSNLEELGTLKKLTNSLLQLTKIHYLNDNHKTQSVSLPEVIELAKNKVSFLAKKKQISINIKVQEVIVKGNKDSLTEVFLILFENAIKYSPKKSEINVVAQKLSDLVKISITDQGIGISEEDLPHIFERFYRADKSRSLTEGFGLGLSIAKNIIDFHKGSVKAESLLDKGTTFIIELPLKDPVV